LTGAPDRNFKRSAAWSPHESRTVAWKRELLLQGFSVGGAITANRLVKLSADNTVVQSAAATDKSIGIAYATQASTDPVVEVVTHGIMKCEAGAAITVGDQLISDASGRVITTAGATDVVVGQALEAAAAAGVMISVLLGPWHVK
jgi:hypothetical protein